MLLDKWVITIHQDIGGEDGPQEIPSNVTCGDQMFKVGPSYFEFLIGEVCGYVEVGYLVFIQRLGCLSLFQLLLQCRPAVEEYLKRHLGCVHVRDVRFLGFMERCGYINLSLQQVGFP
jgi:hypothetical protein